MKILLSFIGFLQMLLCFLAPAFAGTGNLLPGDTAKLRTLIIMFDGLRPDYITPSLMPRLYAFKSKAAYGNDHHSVFPTVTRVNAASYATGSYPMRHGLMDNSLFIPQLDSLKPQNTGSAEQLLKVEAVSGGKLLTAISLGEILQKSGEQLFVYSSGSTGQAFLQNHKVNGAVINPAMILPSSLTQEVVAKLGDPPADATPNSGRHTWITDALCLYTLQNNGPLVSAIWFSDPDGTAHEYGIGVPITNESLKAVDEQFGRIIDSVKARGFERSFNILVSTDHGFITYGGGGNVVDLLVKEGIKQSHSSADIVVAGSGIYVKKHDAALIGKIVAVLQQQEWIGGLFTKAVKPGSYKGFVKGTLSTERIYAGHADRMPDIIVAENWNDHTNGNGYPGTAMENGSAGHGGASRYEIHIPFIASGPSFKSSFVSNIPSSNIDMAPTILKLYGISIPASMQGRVLEELMEGGREGTGSAPQKSTRSESALYKGGRYTVTMETVEWKGHRYINYIQALRVIQ
ncbi:MAG: alkaline phosphatase family protein [Chitinophagaceae bacterium]|nr:alkaline phosphatase family protein [Chitinophagaceae bacterium]